MIMYFKIFHDLKATQNDFRAKQEFVRVGIVLDLWLVDETSSELLEDYDT